MSKKKDSKEEFFVFDLNDALEYSNISLEQVCKSAVQNNDIGDGNYIVVKKSADGSLKVGKLIVDPTVKWEQGFMKSTIEDFLKGGNLFELDDSICLCEAAEGVEGSIDNGVCNFFDKNANEDWWLIEVLGDGTAITYCLD